MSEESYGHLTPDKQEFSLKEYLDDRGTGNFNDVDLSVEERIDSAVNDEYGFMEDPTGEDNAKSAIDRALGKKGPFGGPYSEREE